MTAAKLNRKFKEENASIKVSINRYKQCLKQFNICFFKPKNDKCKACTMFENSLKKTKDVENFTNHRMLIEQSRTSKDEDKKKSND